MCALPRIVSMCNCVMKTQYLEYCVIKTQYMAAWRAVAHVRIIASEAEAGACCWSAVFEYNWPALYLVSHRVPRIFGEFAGKSGQNLGAICGAVHRWPSARCC